MTDTTTSQPPKQGSGKLIATIISTGVALHLATYLKNNYSMPLSEEQLNDLQMVIIGFFVWLTPSNVIAMIKGLMSDWKDLVKTWKAPN